MFIAKLLLTGKVERLRAVPLRSIMRSATKGTNITSAVPVNRDMSVGARHRIRTGRPVYENWGSG